jgi:cytoskeletal protein RodZ
MIKELSLAVIFGLLIGFGLTGTFYFVKQNNNRPKTTPDFVVPSPVPESQTNSRLSPSPFQNTTSIEIISPQNNDIVNTSKATIKGQCSPNSFIVITTSLKNYQLSADAQGSFSQIIDLEPGLNSVNLTAIDQKDQESHTELSLTYSTTKLE